MSESARVWVLPLLFLLTVASLPVQMEIRNRYGEPYPAFLFPYYRGDAQDNGRAKLTVMTLKADGRIIDSEELLAGRTKDPQRYLDSIFPSSGGRARVDAALRNLLRVSLTRELGAPPSSLTVTWDRRWFHLDTGEISGGPTMSRYRVDFEDGP